MNPEVKKLWVEALKSGEYQQTRMRLRDPVGFCCLGVLCDLYAKAHEEAWDILPFNDSYVFRGEKSYLPHEVAEWAGMEDELGTPIDPRAKVQMDGIILSVYLSSLNDNDSYTFEQIAEIIRTGIPDGPERTTITDPPGAA